MPRLSVHTPQSLRDSSPILGEQPGYTPVSALDGGSHSPSMKVEFSELHASERGEEPRSGIPQRNSLIPETAARPGAYDKTAKPRGTSHLLPLFLLLTLFLPLLGTAQIDTNFWFTPPFFPSGQGSIPRGIILSSYQDSCFIIHSAPINDTFLYSTWHPLRPFFKSGALSSSKHAQLYNTPYHWLYHSYSIGSRSPFSVLYDFSNTFGGCYTLKGGNALGTDFTVPMQRFLPSGSQSAAPSSIDIVATHDSTVIQIIPSNALQGGYPANAAITVSLDSEQCYSIRSAGFAASQNLAGTRILASHPVCVNSNNECAIPSTGCVGYIGDQIVSNEHLGRRYVLLRNSSDYEHATIVPTIPGDTLTVTVNGVTTRYYDSVAIDIPLVDTATLIALDKPAAIFQTTAIGCHLDGTQPPRIDCAGSPVVHFSSFTVYNHGVNGQFLAAIVVPTSHVSDFLFKIDYQDTFRSDVITAADFHPLAADPHLSWCLKDLRPYYPAWLNSFDELILKNTAANFQLALLRGDDSTCFFNYSSSYDTPDSLHFSMPSEYCAGDSIIFDYSAPHCIDLVLTGPNGLRLTSLPFILHDVDTSYNGLYRLQAIDTLECLNSTVDSIYIRVYQGNITFDMDSLYCTGDTMTFNYHATNVDSIVIHGPDSLILSQPPFTLPATDTSLSGTYWITARDTTLCQRIRTDSITIRVFPRFSTTVYDTIVQNQLPYTYRDLTVTDSTFSSFTFDTTFLIPSDIAPCDSIYHYHLRLYPNTADSAFLFLCPDAVPFSVNDSVSISSDTVVTYRGVHGEDSVVVYRVILLANSDTSFTDSILERQLPWFFFDTLFNDTVTNYPFHLFNEQGCDSTIHYTLYVFWDGDHCDTSLTFPTLVTPNGDGVNDRFVIGGLLENNCFRFNDLLIYDRTGQLVYHGHNIASEDDFWDPAAHRAPDATYFYVFKAHGVTIHTMHQGAIEVLR